MSDAHSKTQTAPASNETPGGTKALLLGVGLLLLFGGSTLIWLVGQRFAQSPQRTVYEPDESWVPPGSDAPILEEFTLTDRSGKHVGTRDLAGHPYLMSFFYASCPSVCRLQNMKIADLAREYGPRGVKFVAVTCDPETDTVDRLAEYAEKFQANPDQWYFLTGDLLYIRRIGAEIYQVPVDKQTHTEKLVVVDRAGEVRGRFHWNKPAEIEALKKLFDELLAEPTPAH